MSGKPLELTYRPLERCKMTISNKWKRRMSNIGLNKRPSRAITLKNEVFFKYINHYIYTIAPRKCMYTLRNRVYRIN